MSGSGLKCGTCGYANGYHAVTCPFSHERNRHSHEQHAEVVDTIQVKPAGQPGIGTSIFTRLLTDIGEDVRRPGLVETPARAAKAWEEWTAGYHIDPVKLLKSFEDGAELCGDEMVIVRDIEIYSHCEHHLAPFFGLAHIGYIPQLRVVGLSKLARVADAYAKRLQVQERLTNQIANAIEEGLYPKGVGVVIEAKHMCMCSRGVNKQQSTTITSALRGAMKDKPAARAEFMSLVARR